MPEYSNSQLSKFEECALQYKFLETVNRNPMGRE